MHFGLYSPKCNKARPYGLAVETKKKSTLQPRPYGLGCSIVYTLFFLEKKKSVAKEKPPHLLGRKAQEMLVLPKAAKQMNETLLSGLDWTTTMQHNAPKSKMGTILRFGVI